MAVAAKSNPTAKSKAAAGPADPKPAAESDDDAATTDGKDDTPTLAAKLVCALPLPPHPRAWPFPREMGLAGLPHTSFRPGLHCSWYCVLTMVVVCAWVQKSMPTSQLKLVYDIINSAPPLPPSYRLRGSAEVQKFANRTR